MHEVPQVRYRWPQAFDAQHIDASNGLNNGVILVAAIACVQQRSERALVVTMLIDVWDTQLRFPEKRGLRP